VNPNIFPVNALNHPVIAPAIWHMERSQVAAMGTLKIELLIHRLLRAFLVDLEGTCGAG